MASGFCCSTAPFIFNLFPFYCAIFELRTGCQQELCCRYDALLPCVFCRRMTQHRSPFTFVWSPWCRWRRPYCSLRGLLLILPFARLFYFYPCIYLFMVIMLPCFSITFAYVHKKIRNQLAHSSSACPLRPHLIRSGDIDYAHMNSCLPIYSSPHCQNQLSVRGKRPPFCCRSNPYSHYTNVGMRSGLPLPLACTCIFLCRKPLVWDGWNSFEK